MAKASNAQISWLTFKSEDVSEAKNILNSLGGDSTVDAIGLGLPFETISNILFPGTSTLHTYIRYQTLVPALIYNLYSRAPIENPEKALFDLERSLQKALLDGGESFGVYGRVAGEALRYWPSRTYWGAFNALQIFGEEEPDKNRVMSVIAERNCDETLENNNDDDEDLLIDFDSRLEGIAKGLFSDFKRGKLQEKMTFSLTLPEAKFFKEQYEDLYPDSLSSLLVNKKISFIESLKSPFEISNSGVEKLDKLIPEAYHYSIAAQGINFAYRYTLCRHMAENIFKKKPEYKADWMAYAANNEKHFLKWTRNKRKLKGWSIDKLIDAMSKYEESGVDDYLKNLISKSLSCLDKFGDSKFLKEIGPLLIDHEEHRKKNRSHFIDPTIVVAENTKGGSSFGDWMFDYRWSVGQSNARDIVKGLLKK